MIAFSFITICSKILTAEGNEAPENPALYKFYADLKFTYVVSCQIYGRQKSAKMSEAADILELMKK
jgi:callose synthase